MSLERPVYPGDHARVHPDRPAVVMAGSGRVVTYGELDDQSARLARVFRSAGLRVGERVAVLMDNDPRYLTVTWAARRSGLYCVPVNWHLTEAEMLYLLENSGAKVLVANGACAAVAARLRASAPSLMLALAVDAEIAGFDDFDAAIAGESGGPLDDETEGDDLIYTSGTTGRPKGGLRPLTSRHPGDYDLATLGPVWAAMGFDVDTKYLTPGAPLYHAAPLRYATSVTRVGGTNVIMERFDPEAALAAIDTHGITISQWVPTMFVRLLKLPDAVRAGYDLTAHRLAVHAAAPCPVPVKQAMIDWWGPILFEYYGASEGGGAACITSEEWLAHPGSVGRPLGCTVHILDDDGNELPTGSSGVVYAEHGRPVTYLDDPDKTKAAYDARGWITVGDMGRLDDDGYLYLTDRKDNVINSGGVNIYPQEAEDVLVLHPDVADVAVIGVPNEEFGEEVKAVVQAADPTSAGSALADELLRFCRDRLAHYKCPRSIDFVDELPRSPAGKLYKRRVREPYWEGRASRVI